MTDQGAAQEVLQHIDQETLVELAQSLMRIPSFIGEETPLARWVASYLAARGYEVELQEVEPGWFQTVAVLTGSGRQHRTVTGLYSPVGAGASGPVA